MKLCHPTTCDSHLSDKARVLKARADAEIRANEALNAENAFNYLESLWLNAPIAKKVPLPHAPTYLNHKREKFVHVEHIKRGGVFDRCMKARSSSR